MKQASGSVLALMAVVGALLFYLFNWGPLVAPQDAETGASSPPALAKSKIADKAISFAQAHLAVSEDPAAFVNYQTRSDLTGYLQKAGLQADYDKSFARKLPIDYYETEIKDEKAGRDWIVSTSMTDGSVIGWRLIHDRSGGAVSAGTERTARSWLTLMGYDASGFRLLSEGTANKPWLFQSNQAAVGQLRLQLSVRMDGNEAISFQPELPLPAEYVSWMQQQKDWAGRMSNYSLLAMVVLLIAAAIAAIVLRKRIRFVHGLVLTVIFLLIYCFNNVNMYPGLKALSPDQARSWAAVSSVALAMVFTFAFGLAIYLSLTAGEGLWDRIRSWKPLSRWRDPTFGTDVLHGMARGYLLCLFLLGLQSFLYYTGDRYFHVWETGDPSDSPFNMLWPALMPAMAWAAAISEEAVFRVFGIALFRKLRFGTALSVLIPSVIWALGHTSYPIYPVYTRLVEVTILGLFLSWAFLRYGFYTVLFAHATMDSVIMSLQLTSLDSPWYPGLAALYILLPGIIAGALFILHRRSDRPTPLPAR